MAETNLENFIDQWIGQSRKLVTNYFAAKKAKNEEQVELLQTSIDKIAQQTISLLKDDIAAGNMFAEKMKKTDKYFSDEGEFCFSKLFDFEIKIVATVDNELKKEAKSGVVNIPLNNKLAVLLNQVKQKEATFVTLFFSLIRDLKYPVRIVDKFKNSQNLIKWLKVASAKMTQGKLSPQEYRDATSLIDKLLGKLPPPGVRLPASARKKVEFVSSKILKYSQKANDLNSQRQGLYIKTINLIAQLQRFFNQKFSLLDIRLIVDNLNNIKKIIEEEKMILEQVGIIVNQCNKLVTYSKLYSINSFNKVEILDEPNDVVDIVELQAQIKRQ